MLQGNLGLVLWLDGRHNEAQAHLQSAIQTFPGWLSVRAALAETALLAGNFASALEHASEAFRLCTSDVDAAGAALRADEAQPEQVLQITLGGARGAETSLCKRISRSLGAVLVTTAVARLNRAATDPGVRKRIGGLLDRAAALPLEPPDESRALFTRGTLSLLDGADGSARRDLTKALAGDLGEPLRSMAENNLGIALYNLGQTSDAEGYFDAARDSTQTFAAATLNLGIALDERNENRDALRLYEEYLASSVPESRQAEVTAWIDHLRRIYQ